MWIHKNKICSLSLSICVFFFKHILNTQNERGGLLMMVSSMLFFFVRCVSILYRGPLIIRKQFCSEVASRTASSLSSVRRRSRMVEWDGGFDTLIRVRKQKNEGNTLGSLFVFSLGGGNKGVVFCFKRLVHVHLLKIWEVFFGTKDFGWWVESCWIFHPFLFGKTLVFVAPTSSSVVHPGTTCGHFWATF